MRVHRRVDATSRRCRVYCVAIHPFLYSRESTNRARNTRGYCVGQSRRDFIKSTTAAAAVAGIAATLPIGRTAAGALASPPKSPYSPIIAGEPNVKDLAARALEAAKTAGADYADVRFVR